MASTEAAHHYHFDITMTCGGCSGAVDRVLKKTDGMRPKPPPHTSGLPLFWFCFFLCMIFTGVLIFFYPLFSSLLCQPSPFLPTTHACTFHLHLHLHLYATFYTPPLTKTSTHKKQASPPTPSTSKPRPRTSTPIPSPLTPCSRRSRRRARRSRLPRLMGWGWVFE